MMTTAAQTKEDIVKTLGENQAQLRALGVKRLGLFGSFVRGEQKADSDVDMLVEFERGQKTFDHFIQLSFFLEDMLGRSVELVTPEGLSPHIGPYILKEVEYVSVSLTLRRHGTAGRVSRHRAQTMVPVRVVRCAFQ